MGWGRTLILGDIGNRMDIEDTERDIHSMKQTMDRTRRKNRSQDEAIAELYRENGELKLYLAAITRLLAAKGVVTADELKTMVDAIDASDGRKDGQLNGDLG